MHAYSSKSGPDRLGRSIGRGGIGPSRDWSSADYGPGARCVDTNKPFNVAISFPLDAGGFFLGMGVRLSQTDGKCNLTACLDDYSISWPGSPKRDGLVELQEVLEAGMTPVISYWSSKHELFWFDGPGPDGKGPCKADIPTECRNSVTFSSLAIEPNGQAAVDACPKVSLSPTPAPPVKPKQTLRHHDRIETPTGAGKESSFESSVKAAQDNKSKMFLDGFPTSLPSPSPPSDLNDLITRPNRTKTSRVSSNSSKHLTTTKKPDDEPKLAKSTTTLRPAVDLIPKSEQMPTLGHWLVVTQGFVNVRNNMDLDSKVLRKYEHGDIVTGWALKSDDGRDWIAIAGGLGYVITNVGGVVLLKPTRTLSL